MSDGWYREGEGEMMRGMDNICGACTHSGELAEGGVVRGVQGEDAGLLLEGVLEASGLQGGEEGLEVALLVEGLDDVIGGGTVVHHTGGVVATGLDVGGVQLGRHAACVEGWAETCRGIV